MLKVYGASWCPHCQKAAAFLEEKGIEFEYVDIESQEEAVVKKVIEVNGGDDWVVPTLEYRGKWREGKVFEAGAFLTDLEKLGMAL